MVLCVLIAKRVTGGSLWRRFRHPQLTNMMMLRCAAAAASLRNATTAAQAPRRVVAPLRNAGLCGCGCGDTVVSHRALRTSSVSNSAAAEGLFDPHELARAREAEESRRKASTPSDAPSAVLQAGACCALFARQVHALNVSGALICAETMSPFTSRERRAVTLQGRLLALQARGYRRPA